MTTWNYRIIRTLEKKIGSDGDIEWLQVHRVYYDGEKITSWGKEPVIPGGESQLELENDLKHLLDACKLPVLKAEEMPQ